ncbi:MAG: type II CRISPR-associated endonuclease Cas1 [Alphaproteobacteria bacterium]|nr:type II CRISPR-associated endonuclease Cas1 [Alphaproteobacteria bacterium]
MPNRIIEIATDNQKLSVFRGFLRIEKEGNVTDVPFNHISALMVTAHQVVYTHNLLQRLCEEGIPLVVLGKNYLPNGILLSLVGHVRQTEIQHLQTEQKLPIYKKIWQKIIQEKIKNQSRVLDLICDNNPLEGLSETVLSGDTDNREGYAAKLYFKALFGADFIRNRDTGGINAFLNYGYAVLRSALARYVVASGLNPVYGIEHHNKLNPFCLVDDLIEPFRPLVDITVYRLFEKDTETTELTVKHKALFAGLLTTMFKTKTGESPLYMILQQCVWDLVNIYKTGRVEFNFTPYLFEEETND